MHVRGRLTTISLVAVAALITSITPASAAGGTTRYVDGDGHASPGNCDGSGSAFKHIQKAVNASGAGDTVVVCPGTYEEQVTITGDRDGLTLKSSKPFGAIIKTPSTLKPSFGLSYYTVLVKIDRVDDVTVRGFRTIARTAAPCTPLWVTMMAVASRRASIRGNRLLAPGTSNSSPCYQAWAVVVGSGLGDPSTGGRAARSTSATVAFNEVRDSIIVGIQSEAVDRAVTVHVIHNSVRAYFGHAPAGGSSTADTGPISGYSGIQTFARVSGVIRDNVVQGSTEGPVTGPTFNSGLTFYGADQNGPINVHDNIVRRVATGVNALYVKHLTLADNQVTHTRTGMYLTQVVNGVFLRNTFGAAKTGILVDNGSSGNVLRHNTVGGSGGTCTDGSSGGGTAGTANTWTSNTASVSSDPAGICAVAP
jgi:hypothetical protein